MKHIKPPFNRLLSIVLLLLASYTSYNYIYGSYPLSEPSTSSLKGKPIELNDIAFRQLVYDYTQDKEWTYRGTIPCVIDFNANWCGPCQRLKPRIEKLADEYNGRIIVYSVNVDSCPNASAVMGIKTIPTIFMIPTGGELPTKNVGVLPYYKLSNQVKRLLLKEK